MNPPVYTPEPEAAPSTEQLATIGRNVAASLAAGIATVDQAVAEVELALPNPYQRTILFGLRNRSKHVYAGTVPAATIAKRRAARKARRATRQAQRSAA